MEIIGELIDKKLNSGGERIEIYKMSATKFLSHVKELWRGNRSPDMERIPEIRRYIEKERRVDGIFALAYMNDKFIIYDGAHRWTALKTIKDERFLEELTVIVDIIWNVSDLEITKRFQALNQAVPVPEPYWGAGEGQMETRWGKQVRMQVLKSLEGAMKYFQKNQEKKPCWIKYLSTNARSHWPKKTKGDFYTYLTQFLIGERRFVNTINEERVIKLLVDTNALLKDQTERCMEGKIEGREVDWVKEGDLIKNPKLQIEKRINKSKKSKWEMMREDEMYLFVWEWDEIMEALSNTVRELS